MSSISPGPGTASHTCSTLPYQLALKPNHKREKPTSARNREERGGRVEREDFTNQSAAQSTAAQPASSLSILPQALTTNRHIKIAKLAVRQRQPQPRIPRQQHFPDDSPFIYPSIRITAFAVFMLTKPATPFPESPPPYPPLSPLIPPPHTSPQPKTPPPEETSAPAPSTPTRHQQRSDRKRDGCVEGLLGCKGVRGNRRR